jgi:TrmH family RNA methyltransferase
MAGDAVADLYATPLDGPVAFLFGNEAQGLDGATRGLADAVVRIPIPGRAESLNLAAAATVCLFEWARRRAAAPR